MDTASSLPRRIFLQQPTQNKQEGLPKIFTLQNSISTVKAQAGMRTMAMWLSPQTIRIDSFSKLNLFVLLVSFQQICLSRLQPLANRATLQLLTHRISGFKSYTWKVRSTYLNSNTVWVNYKYKGQIHYWPICNKHVPGLVVMGDDSCLRGRGFKSWHHILDVLDIFSLWFVVKIVLFVWKDQK